MAPSEAIIRRKQGTVDARRAIHRDAVEILRTEFARPISLEEVAGRVATSSRHLQRVFAETGGVGFCAYLRLIRMSRAAELLATGDVSVTEVASCVGYSDPGQFSKAYKRTYGVSPSESRGRHHGPADGDLREAARACRPALQQDLSGR